MFSFFLLAFLLSYFQVAQTIPIEENHTSAYMAADSSKILIIGDTQRTSIWEFWREKNNHYRAQVLDKLAAENPIFILHLGDVIFQGSSASHWEEFDNNAKSINDNNIPIFPLLGNHEYTGKNDKALQHYFDHFPIIEGQMWYTHQYKNIGFIHLNSNFSELSEQEIEAQNTWFDETLQAYDMDENICFIIVACHQPPFTNSKVVHDDLDVQENFVPLFNQSQKTRLFLSGHSHSYEHFLKSGKHFVVSGGGGGPRQRINTSQPKHIDLFDGGNIRPLHYCQIHLEQNHLDFSMHKFEDNQWMLADSFSIQ